MHRRIYLYPVGQFCFIQKQYKINIVQKGGFMLKDRQLRRMLSYSEIVETNDIEKLRKSFIETLTHDLKTPILAQIRVLELLLQNRFGELKREQSEMLQLSLDSCQYMYEMVSTLISTYKFENEEFKLNYSYFNIINLIEENIKSVEKYLKDNNIKIVVIPEIKTPMIAGDVIRIQKVLQALFFNSLNSAFKNSIMKIYLKEKNKKISIEIENHSGYIPDEKLEKMFKLCTSHSEKYDKIGIGIGLFLAKKIIEKHKGKIIAKSDIRQKNIIGFEIPIEAPQEIFYENCI